MKLDGWIIFLFSPNPLSHSHKFLKVGQSRLPNSNHVHHPLFLQHHCTPKHVLQVEKIELMIGLWSKMTEENQ